MSSLANAQAALAQLTTDVQTLLGKPAGVAESDVQALADGMTALDAQVTAVLNPPAPAPTPAAAPVSHPEN